MYDKAFHAGNIEEKAFLITGGSGFIGSNIVEYLLHHNAGKVRVLDNLATSSYDNLRQFEDNPAFEFIHGDIRELTDCYNACDGIDLLCHQAAMGSVPRSIKDPVLTNNVNAAGFVNILTAAKDSGIKKMVYASSSSVYGDEPNLPKVEAKTGRPLSPYAVSKATNELYAAVFAKTYNLQLIGLRYFNVFGPRQDPKGAYAAVIPLFIDSILNKRPVYIDGDGEQTRDFTFVENAVQANIKALTTENSEAFGQVYNIAVGENYSVIHLYNSIAEIIGSSQKPNYREPRAGDIKNSLADISRANRLLDYHPEVTFHEGLKRTISYFKELQPAM